MNFGEQFRQLMRQYNTHFQEILLVLVFVFDVSMTPGIPGATAFQIKELSLKTEY